MRRENRNATFSKFVATSIYNEKVVIDVRRESNDQFITICFPDECQPKIAPFVSHHRLPRVVITAKMYPTSLLIAGQILVELFNRPVHVAPAGRCLRM